MKKIIILLCLLLSGCEANNIDEIADIKTTEEIFSTITVQTELTIQTEPTIERIKVEEKTELYKEVPLFFQTDYQFSNYGNFGTIASHGCGITSLSMVASYLNDSPIYPDELAKKYGKYNTKIGSSWSLFSDTCDELNITLEERTWDMELVIDSLKEGKIIIANAHKESPFTKGGHYIVLTGITDSGKILVNDPYKGNYGQWNGQILKEGFKNGFDKKYFYDCFPMWIYSTKDKDVITNTKEINEIQYKRIDGQMPYYIYNNNIKSNTLIIYLHGYMDKGLDEKAFTATGLPGVLKYWQFENINSYIICPQLYGTISSWTDSKALELLEEIINNFTSNKQIDEIILMGQGEGAKSAIEISQKLQIFSKLILFSAYDPGVEIKNDINTTFYVGNKEYGEDGWSITSSKNLIKKFTNSKIIFSNSSQAGLIRDILTSDNNKNKVSDFFEELY